MPDWSRSGLRTEQDVRHIPIRHEDIAYRSDQSQAFR
jgi:hypothetical protein